MPRRKKPQEVKPVIEYLNDEESIITPDGVAAFAYLDEPDEAFNKVKHRITVFFDAKCAKFKKFVTLLKKLNKGWLVSQGEKVTGAGPIPGCIKKADEKMAETCGVAVGTPYIQFASTPREDDEGNVIPVPVVGANGKKTKLKVFGTDLVCVETTVAGYKTPQGIGITCYLNGVQLLEKRYKGGGGGGTSFGVRDDYLSDDEDDDESFDPEEGDADEEEHDDFLGDDDDDDPSDDLA